MRGAARHVVEVAGRVDRVRALLAERRRLEQVELDLGMRVEGEAAVGRLLERPLQHVAGVGHRRLAVGRRDVAEHAGGRVDLAAPRQDLERRRIGQREQVGLVGARQALDRGPVEAEPFAEGSLDLGRGDGDGLEGADDVGEPQPHELDATLLDRAKNEVALLVHPAPFLGRFQTSGRPRTHRCNTDAQVIHFRYANAASSHQITHTPQVERSRGGASGGMTTRTATPVASHRGGRAAIREERTQQIDERRAELERMSARYAGMFTESLASIREGWPE